MRRSHSGLNGSDLQLTLEASRPPGAESNLSGPKCHGQFSKNQDSDLPLDPVTDPEPAPVFCDASQISASAIFRNTWTAPKWSPARTSKTRIMPNMASRLATTA